MCDVASVSDAVKVLVVDAGNTSVKFTAFEGNEVLWVQRDDCLPALDEFVPSVIYFASVRSQEQSALLHADLAAHFPASRWCHVQSEKTACGVKNAYHEPSRLGVDRWLGVVAAHHVIKGKVVIVDAGTAIKVDVVNQIGEHLGGYIAPGLALMETTLLANTAKIRYDAGEVISGQGLPDSTARAVTEGCYEMALGFLERLYHRYTDYTWVVTGGDARALLASLGVPLVYEPHLVAYGATLVGSEKLRGNP